MNPLENISQQHPIVLFDGVCVLCNAWIDRLMRWDKAQRFRLLPLQSDLAQAAIKMGEEDQTLAAGFGNTSAAVQPGTQAPAPPSPSSKFKNPGSVLLYYQGKWYSESSAVLRMALLLGFPFSLLGAGLVLPAFVRNSAYRFIARHRYQWWGKKNSCRVPTAAEKKWFLTD